MRTIIIWQTTRGPVLVDKESAERIENCKQIDIAPIHMNRLVEATLHLWPDDVAGTVQHGLEPTLERVCVEFAPLFPSIVDACGVPNDFMLRDNDDQRTLDACKEKFPMIDFDLFGANPIIPPTSSGPGGVT